MNNLSLIQEASLGGCQWFGGPIMEFDFVAFQAMVFPPDRLSPQWLVSCPAGDYWANSLPEALDWLCAHKKRVCGNA